MWACPKCQRSFKRKDQVHSCKLINKESLLVKCDPKLRRLYYNIAGKLKKFGVFREETVGRDVIFFKTKSTFLALKVKKDHLIVEFFLERAEFVPPVFKILQTSRHRVVHLVAVDRPEDIDRQLINWIRSSYELVSK